MPLALLRRRGRQNLKGGLAGRGAREWTVALSHATQVTSEECPMGVHKGGCRTPNEGVLP
jgi:hypothetical protein